MWTKISEISALNIFRVRVLDRVLPPLNILLFPYSDQDSDDTDSEPEQFDSKKAKMELDEYADVDWKKNNIFEIYDRQERLRVAKNQKEMFKNSVFCFKCSKELILM